MLYRGSRHPAKSGSRELAEGTPAVLRNPRVPKSAVAVIAAASFGVGCGDPEAQLDGVGGLFDADAGPLAAIPTPQIDRLASAQPYPLVTVRGWASGRRIFVEGAGNPLSTGIQPGGEFCLDVRLPAPGAYALELWAQAEDGRLSEASGPMRVRFDPNLPSPPRSELIPTCTGADPSGCEGNFEVCGNGRDDDCNSLIDADDPQCQPCVDDPLEPNDQAGSPRIPTGAYDDLALCGGDPDWYGIYLQAGDTLQATLRFRHTEGNLDLELWTRNLSTRVDQSISGQDVETLTYTATTTETHQLRVFGGPTTSNRYRLELEVE